MNGLAKGAQWAKGLQLLGELKHCQLQPDVITLNSLISACGKASEWPLALELGQNLQLTGDVITYNSLLDACRQAKLWQLGLMLLEEAKNMLEVNMVTYTTAISACGEAGKWQEALELLQEAVKKITPNVFLYNASITACDEHWQEALLLFNTLEGAVRKPWEDHVAPRPWVFPSSSLLGLGMSPNLDFGDLHHWWQ